MTTTQNLTPAQLRAKDCGRTAEQVKVAHDRYLVHNSGSSRAFCDFCGMGHVVHTDGIDAWNNVR